ncbi:amino acid adenylation domain-containing protein [Pseudonocardia sp. WMMC193]|uniref:non-ribosomal peptide synthetase n=1 Tax=Pseudonocardia sp. WMMC193 TaxID=2911965 RepID=UPI001F3C1E27|nr:amino acid adenylation domain-containing protein [Pseudonocardia sp. WMMC193]MCF7549505.1 amino acid adenylation domain-containing protein [Pseudonocardia sp. WMMC193]
MSETVELDGAALRVLLAELLEEEPADIADDANLFELGLESITLMRLVSRWRGEGRHVGFAALAENPTVEAWTRLLAGEPVARADEPAAGSAPGSAAGSAADAGEEFDLALLQHAYWVGRDAGQQLGGVAPHLYLEFDGPGIDPDRLRAAFDGLVRRHPMLRVRIGDDGRQRIARPSSWQALRVHDLREAEPEDAARELDRIRDETSHELLDIEGGEVFRAAVSLLPPGLPGGPRARLHLDVDMVAADAVSYRAMLADLAALYADPDATLPALRYTYREYLHARPEARAAAKAEAARYWADRLATLPGPPELPRAVDPGDRARARRLAFHLDTAEWAAVAAAARRRGVTPAVAVATVFAEVVGAWSADPRFVLNVPMFDREQVHPDIDRVVGDFTSSVLLEVDLTEPRTLHERAQAVQRRLHADASHKDHSGLEVLRDLGRRNGEQLIAPVVFTSGIDLGELFDPGVRAHFGDPVWIISQGPQVVLDAQVSELDGGLLVNWDIRENEFAAGVPAAMFAAFEGLVRGLARDQSWTEPVGDLRPADQRAAREAANDTATPGSGALLHERFFAHAAERADRPAVCWADGHTMGHGELADRALRVAAGLHARGVRPGDPVAVTLPRGPEQVVAVLGVLAAGGAYVPVGIEQPAARAERIASVSGHAVVVGAGVPLSELERADPLPAPVPVDAEQPAYLLFTSGSTGEPKGVEVPHRAAVTTLDDLTGRFRLGPEDRTLAVSALDFDLSVFDVFAMLDVGGAVVTLTEGRQREAEHWAELVRTHRVTVLNCVPALLDALLATGADLGDSLRQVLLGGDRVGVDLPGRLRARVPGCGFAGLGGTTETAIHSTVCVVDEIDPSWQSVPYGTPLDDVVLRVVDPRGRDTPDWVPGELWIGGGGVAAGYRGDPERTRDRFVTRAGTRWYRTGDTARYRPGGTVEFLGRRDNQVKVNGFRIELGEVEAATLQVPGVRSALAVVVGGAAPSLAVAVVADGPVGDGSALLAELGTRLPPHMMPRTVLALDAMPLTPNGKLDRAAVRSRVAAASGDQAPVAPRTALETVIAHVWQSVLEQDAIGVTHSLFAVGGDSVLATLIVSRLRETLDTREVSVRMLFGAPTIAGLAAAMLAASTEPDRLREVAEIVLEVEAMSEEEAADAVRALAHAEGDR